MPRWHFSNEFLFFGFLVGESEYDYTWAIEQFNDIIRLYITGNHKNKQLEL